MSQVTYTVGLLDGDAKLVYSGTLELQLQIDNLGTTPTAGLLVLQGFTPLLLTAVSGGGSAWNLNGSNDSLAVPFTSIYPNVQPQGQAPPYVSGSIALTPSGQAQQSLLLMGWTGSGAAPAAHVQSLAAADAALQAGAGVTQYNLSLALLDTAFAQTGTAAFTGTGQMVQIGPVSRQWRVTGTLRGGGLPDGGIAIQGWGSEFFWGGSGQSGSTQVTLSVVASTFISGVSDGTLTVNGATSFFVGTPVAQATIAVPQIAGSSAAEPV
jgi:hypothetical protein